MSAELKMVSWRKKLQNQIEHRWDGYSQTLGQYMTNAYCQILSVYELLKENTRLSTMWIFATLFDTFSEEKIHSFEEFAINMTISNLCDQADTQFYQDPDVYHATDSTFQSLFMFELGMLQEIIFMLAQGDARRT